MDEDLRAGLEEIIRLLGQIDERLQTLSRQIQTLQPAGSRAAA